MGEPKSLADIIIKKMNMPARFMGGFACRVFGSTYENRIYRRFMIICANLSISFRYKRNERNYTQENNTISMVDLNENYSYEFVGSVLTVNNEGFKVGYKQLHVI